MHHDHTRTIARTRRAPLPHFHLRTDARRGTLPERTHAWLADNCPLCDWSFDKSLQKIAESYRVDAAAKRELLKLRRMTEKGISRRSFAK